MHELIVTEAWDSPSYPHKKENKEKYFPEEDKCSEQRKHIM